jgi:SNF2 family DNA or RNA helicase
MAHSPTEAARPYQLEDAHKIVQWGGRGILGHKTGLGKTLIALTVWEQLQQPRRVLVVGTNSSMSVWLREIPRWTGCPAVHVTGSQGERALKFRAVRELFMHTDVPAFVLCNFDILRRELATLQKLPLEMLIIDEAHKVRNRKTASWKAIKALKTKYCVAASATLASRGPQDLWGILNILDPYSFTSYWRYVNTFCYVNAGPFGREVVGAKNANILWKMLTSKYYTSRTYEEVLPDLPPVTREVVEVDIADDYPQDSVYWQLNKEMMASFPSDDAIETTFRMLVPNALSKITRLRQLLVSPEILGLHTVGAGIRYLMEALEDDPHTVIFTPFADALPFIKQALEKVESVRGVFTLQGGMKPEEVVSRIEAFKHNQGVMICTIAFAQSFSLDTVHTAYFLGFSWDPTENIQAEGRLRRMDSKLTEGVVVKYIVHSGTIDESVREVLNGKQMTIQAFMQDQKARGNKRLKEEGLSPTKLPSSSS